jgi:hypothetical protein
MRVSWAELGRGEISRLKATQTIEESERNLFLPIMINLVP